MPNWASVTYKVTGKRAMIDKLEKVLEELQGDTEPLVENDFGNLWLGCIVCKLGGDWKEIGCRGEVLDFENEDNVLTISQETAWGELSGFRHFLELALPGIEIYYYVEESGMCIYQTNDFDGRFFPERYHLEGWDYSEYYNDLKEAAKGIGDIIGEPLETDEESIENGINKYNSSLDEDSDEQLYFYKIRLVVN